MSAEPRIAESLHVYGTMSAGMDTTRVLGHLRWQVLQEISSAFPTAEEVRLAESVDWRKFASPRHLRRLDHLYARLRDYPSPRRVLPTRLGNILRHYEDELPSRSRIDMKAVPPELVTVHDRLRQQMEMHCFLLFGWLSLVALAAVCFMNRWQYLAVAACTGAVLAWLSYRALLITGRTYGEILLSIDRTQGGREHP